MRWLRRGVRWIERQVHERLARFLVGAFAVNAVFVVAFGAADLTPPGGPTGVDLQLSFLFEPFARILSAWAPAPGQLPAIEHRLWLTIAGLDMLFPIAYAALLSGLYLAVTQTSGQRYAAVVYLPFAAMAADWVENLILLFALLQSPWAWWPGPLDLAAPARVTRVTVWLMSFMAATKFTLIAITTAFILFHLVKGEAFRVIRMARHAVLSLLIGTLPLFILPQGRDLLVSLSYVPDGWLAWHRTFFVVWLVIWAFSAWYWSRVLLDADAAAGQSQEFIEWSKWLPRWAGGLTLIVPGGALLVQAKREDFAPILLVLGVLCIVLGAVFVVFVSWRDTLFPELTRGRAAYDFDRRQVDPMTWKIFRASLSVSLTVFALFVWQPLVAGQLLGAVAILAIVAANTVFFGSAAVFVLKTYHVPVEVIALACAVTFSSWNDNHDLRLEAPATYRPTLGEKFRDWFRDLPPIGGDKPIVIVTAEGGGIRAAYWAAAALHYLESDAAFAGAPLSRRVFAISSVSGGSFGAAVYAGLKRDLPHDRASHGRIGSEILKRPFLAPMVAMLVTGDALQWFLPRPFPSLDRSRAMEDGFAAAYRESVRHGDVATDSMRESLVTFASRAPHVPLLFFNSTSVQTGQRLVASAPVWLPARLHSTAARDPVDLHALLGGADLSMTTAVHNTARFPYISPAGRLRSWQGHFRGHAVDGGYFENTGAETALDLIDALEREQSGLRVVVIALSDSLEAPAAQDPDAVPWQKSEAVGELLAPVRTLLQTRAARGVRAIDRLRARVKDGDFIEVRACDVSKPEDRDAERQAPLGWQLSRKMIAMLDQQAGDRCLGDERRQLVTALAGQTPGSARRP
jgi:hypothetical protein